MSILRKIFQWVVSFVLAGLGLLYLRSAGQIAFSGEAGANNLRDAGVSLSLAVALIGLAAVMIWVFGEGGSESQSPAPAENETEK